MNSQIEHCILSLTSDKVTERKKAAEDLTHWMNNDGNVNSISAASKHKQSEFTNWDRIFESSKKYFTKECEKLEKDERSKENPSANILNGWKNQKRKIISLPAFILKKSCFGTNTHIPLNSLLSYILLLLDKNQAYRFENFSWSAILILQTYLLYFPQYYLHVPQDKWKVLLHNCMWIYEHNVGNGDHSSCIYTIKGIVTCFRLSKPPSEHHIPASVAFRHFPKFLLNAFKFTNVAKQHRLLEALLSLLYTTCKEFGSEWRCFLARLGEETFPIVLDLWENKSSMTQELLLKYLNLQLIIHCPGQDGECVEASEFCENRELWQKYLVQLYRLVFDYLNDIERNIRMMTGSGSKGHDRLSDEFRVFSSRLLVQVLNFTESTGYISLNVTQTMQMSCSSQRIKKRKVEMSFQDVLELFREGTHEGKIPCLQILTEMLEHHRRFFGSARVNQLLDVLLDLLSQSKLFVVTEELLRCLCSLAKVSSFLHSVGGYQIPEKKWNTVSDLTLRLIAGKQCSKSGMCLIRALIEDSAFEIGQHIGSTVYVLFCRGALGLNSEALKLLQCLLMSCTLTKVLKVEDYVLRTQDQCDSRIMLLNVLLPLNEERGNKLNVKKLIVCPEETSSSY